MTGLTAKDFAVKEDGAVPDVVPGMLWVAGDQLLKGAAWNAVQIAEELAKLSAKPKTMAAE